MERLFEHFQASDGRWVKIGCKIAFYFSVMFAITIGFRQGIAIVPSMCAHGLQVGLFSTPAQVMECFGGADMASYVHGVAGIGEHGFDAFRSYGFGCWAPGFFVVEFILLAIKNDLPLPLVLFLVESALWAFLFARLSVWIERVFGLRETIAVALPLIFFAFPFFTQSFLWNLILLSEPIASACFFIAALEIWGHIATNQPLRLCNCFLLGGIFSLAAYMRAQFDLIFMVSSLATFLLLAALWVTREKKNAQIERTMLKVWFRAFGLVVLAYIICIAPWKIYTGGSMADLGYMWRAYSWSDESYYNTHPDAGFVRDGGAMALCKINPDQCAAFKQREDQGNKIENREFIRASIITVLTHPFALLAYKLPYFWKAWQVNDFLVTDYERISNIILGFLLLPCMLYLMRIRWQVAGVALYYLVSLGVGSVGFSMIFHFEARYTIHLKFYLVIIMILTVAHALSSNPLFEKKKA